MDRGFGIISILRSIKKFWSANTKQRIIFGSSEICLYLLLSRKRDVWVFTGLGRLLIGGNVRSRIVRWTIKRLYRGQLIIVLNEQDRAEVFGFTNCEPRVINGEGYKFSCGYNQKLRLKPRNEIRFVYVGRLLRSKGVHQLLSDFSKYSHENWTLTLIGDNDFNNSDSVSQVDIDDLVKKSKGSVILTGYRSDVASILSEQDFYVTMSLREGLPFSVLDAINAGLYLILSPVPGHLSFEGLPGVQFAKDGLKSVFDEVSRKSDRMLNFDREKRLEICKNKFGQDRIVQQIAEMIFGQND